MRYLSCKFRAGIECGESGEVCDSCGWNPLVEAEREQLIRSGEVKGYLKFDLENLTNRIESMQKNNRKRRGEDDG